jgi:hypothetical protein
VLVQIKNNIKMGFTIMRLSYSDTKDSLQTSAQFKDWRFANAKEKQHRQATFRTLSRRPRFRISGE